MKKSIYFRFMLSLTLMLALFSPTAVLALGDGKKHFTQGMKHEDAEDWDKAAESFALAVADNPKNPEYRLHYVRALFNASQMYMKKGRTQAEEKDYAGAYISFRKAYAYDPVNELAKSEMERMLRLQQREDGKTVTNTNGVKLVETEYTNTANTDDIVVPQKLEVLRDVGPYPAGIKLMKLIRDLAQSLDLNVLFDTESRLDTRDVKIELKDVTAAKALDYLFLQENLFFQKVGPRTILVAGGNRRQNFQQLVLRTFYLANSSPKDVAKVVQTAIPAQPGRTPTIPLIDEATNSITVRDTSENIRIISSLISALDKDRAEVVMDVAIYEVSKTDLLRLGNQIGDSSSLTNLGGTTRGVVGIGENSTFGGTAATAAANIIPRAFGVGLVIPAVNLVAFQNKQNSKLLASTQIHAFNNEDSSARIGQRVPVITATISNGFNNGNGNNTGNNGGFLSDVVNYEQVGLTLKFKPIVFPNQDVQVAMEIESKDVVACSTTTNNPCFSERTIKGTARVQNNKTLLLASAAQNVESNGRQGLPLLGLIPILGRLFTAPTRDNRQVDIVIAITPRVIRAPAILPEDEEERPTGSLAVPTSGSLEAMIIEEERGEQLALARRIPKNQNVQLPDQKIEEQPTYVRSDATESAKVESKTETTTAEVSPKAEETIIPKTETAPSIVKPIDTSAKTLNLTETSASPEQTVQTPQKTLPIETEEIVAPKTETTENSVKPSATIQLLPSLSEMKRGEKTKIAVMVQSAAAFRSAVLGLKFDANKVAVRTVGYGDVFGKEMAQTPLTPYVNQGGKMFVSLSTDKDILPNSSGVLAYIEIEALTDGKPEVAFDSDMVNIMSVDGKTFTVKY